MGIVRDAPHSDTTFKIIGACMAVHNDLRPGHREQTYQNALALRLRELDVAFEEQVPLQILEANSVPVALYVPDFIVNSLVIVEIKAQSHQLTGDDIAQCIDYLAGSTCEMGLLVNFGRPRLEWKRLFPPKKILEHRRKNWGKKLRTSA